jgi:hypothetical protein
MKRRTETDISDKLRELKVTGNSSGYSPEVWFGHSRVPHKGSATKIF